MKNNGHSIEREKEQRILNEAWEIVYEAIAKGYIKEACKRIQSITGVSETEAIDIIEHIREEISKNDYVPPYGAPTKLATSDSKQQITREKNLIPCAVCNQQISKHAEFCPHCGQPTGVHICPKCNSANTKVISGASKATSIFLWGPFAANNVISKFQCKDCGHKW